MKKKVGFSPSSLAACAALALIALLPAPADAASYVANLSGAQEQPPNASPGTGQATLTFDAAAHTMSLNVSFSDLVGLTMMAHIHCCNLPNAPVVVQQQTAPGLTGFPLDVHAGTYSHTFDTLSASTYTTGFFASHGNTGAGAEAALLAGLNSGHAYLNIHTDEYMAGEIRGFFAASPIPESQPYALMLASLGVIGFVWLRRQQRENDEG